MHKRIPGRKFHFASQVSKLAKAKIWQILGPNPDTRLGIEKLMDTSWFMNFPPKGSNHFSNFMIRVRSGVQSKRYLQSRIDGYKHLFSVKWEYNWANLITLNPLIEGQEENDDVEALLLHLQIPKEKLFCFFLKCNTSCYQAGNRFHKGRIWNSCGMKSSLGL